MEVMLAIVIVGVGITAAMQLFATCSQQNRNAARMTVAINLGNNIQELMAPAAYTDPRAAWTWGLESGETCDSTNTNLDLDDFDGKAFNPPVNAGWVAQSQLSQYTQSIAVSMVSATDFKTVVTDSPSAVDTGVRRVVVTVSFKRDANSASEVLYTLSFLRFNDLAAKGGNEQ